MKRCFSVDDLLAVRRLGPAAASPNGRFVVCAVARHDPEANTVTTHLYRVATDGGPLAQLTRTGTSNTSPRFSPDGTLGFLSNRAGSTQVWALPSAGGDPVVLTAVKDGVSAFAWADGSLLYASTTTPADPPKGVRTAERLLFRHWNEWRDHHRNVVFRADLASGHTVVLSDTDADCPPIALEGERDFDARPGSDEVALVWNPDPQPALGTNNTVWRVAPASEPSRVTTSEACEVDPRWSPDGRYLAWLGMSRPGYESDARNLFVLDTKTDSVRCLTATLDRPIRRFQWARSGDSILFDGQDWGRHSIWRVSLDGVVGPVLQGRYAQLVDELPGGDLVVSLESLDAPADLWRLAADTGALTRLTALNPQLADVEWHAGEDLWWEGADGDRVHGFLVLPPGERERVPLLVLVHGGPQSAFMAHFHMRWNPQVFAGAGVAVLLVNPRGSTGYGQAFTDQIRGDWGGRVVADLMAGIDHALREHPELDGERLAAAGGSFGGYMMCWLQGHSDRFRALICHAGIFELRNLYWGTEELWFPAWEFGGSPAEASSLYDELSPSRTVERWSTPMLVLHGEQDFRVPVLEGIAAFTALQQRGVPSRLVLFPEEGHWIQKPANARRWYQECLGWLERHLTGRVESSGSLP